MDDATILILGANGQLGRALAAKYPKARAVKRDTIDICDTTSLAQYDWSGIKIILNAAAYTNVDGAETAEGRVAAWQTNASAVKNLVSVALEHDLTLVHISSDYVFDGTKTPHTETEPFSPLGVYGDSKAAGDLAVSLAPKHYILRTTWVIGDGKNFVRTMLELGQKGVKPSVVNDQIGRLTFTTALVEAINHLLTMGAAFGTYNMTNEGESVSWAEIADQVFSDGGLDVRATGISTTEYFKNKPEAAPRPLQSTMDLSKIEATGFKPSDWRDDLKQYVLKETSK